MDTTTATAQQIEKLWNESIRHATQCAYLLSAGLIPEAQEHARKFEATRAEWRELSNVQ